MFRRRPWLGVLFALPALLMFTTVVIYPLISGAYLSLTDSSGGPKKNFVGFDNYASLFDDPRLLNALGNTLQYALVVVLLQNGIGLLIARALYHRPRVRRHVTAFILLPTLVSAVMSAFIFSYIFAPDGVLNTVLGAVGLDSLQRVWLGDPATAIYCVAAVGIWGYCGYSAIIFLAGYVSIEQELLEAAEVDGATGFKRFRYIEWPLIAPALTVNLALNVIGSLRVFELPLVMTNGGPASSTVTLNMLIYTDLFGGRGQFAYAVTVAMFSLVLVVVISIAMTTLLRARERKLS